MASHHEPLGAMGPVVWSDVPGDSLKEYLDEIFSETQTIVESIPAPAAKAAATSAGRARSKTESAAGDLQQSLSLRQKSSSIAQARDLSKEWKEVKVNPRENPLGINVYKLGSKDGRGAWFARRSVHEGLSFDDWKKGLEMEFAETMKVQGSPGSGNIRGIGADKRVESQTIEDAGQLQVFQLSAQFPGPTAPRDFVTLLLTSETSVTPGDGSRPLRQFMIVSKPCDHPECPPRQGIIRGYYESVEVIREVPVDPVPAKRSMSSVDLGRDESKRRSTLAVNDNNDFATAIEWIMVTRSDPGGSVPRFLIEKGTPPGIIGDAGKFIKWITAKSIQGFEKPSEEDDVINEAETSNPEENKPISTTSTTSPTSPVPHITTTRADHTDVDAQFDEDIIPSSNGLYGIITGAFGAAGSLVATGLLKLGGTYSEASNDTMSEAPTLDEEHNEEKQPENDTASDTSSVRSFASALERSVTEEKSPESTTESQSETSKSNLPLSQHDKELKKLEERRRKLDEKAAKMQQRWDTKLLGEKEKDAATLAKLREKHEREVAKREEKYQRELRKIEEKRESEERKAEQRRRKAQDREEKANLTLELEKVRAERDVARRQIEILEGQVGALQAQNTMLVRKLGKMGLLDRSDSTSSFKNLRDADTKTVVSASS